MAKRVYNTFPCVQCGKPYSPGKGNARPNYRGFCSRACEKSVLKAGKNPSTVAQKSEEYKWHKENHYP